MPQVPLVFRSRCGGFHATFIAFMFRRAKRKKEMRCPTLKLANRRDGVMAGLLLTVIFFSNLLMQCGDVEPNPGPPKCTRQTSLTTVSGGRKLSVDKDASGQTGRGRSVSDAGTEPTMSDLMAKMNAMNGDFNNKLDELRGDMKDIKDSFTCLKEEVKELKSEVSSLKQSNDELSDANKKLNERLDQLELKADDLEGRSKRNNVIVHGLPRHDHETNEDCEKLLRDTLTSKMGLSKDLQFDRVHRINGKTTSPVIARCTLYKEKVQILKAKRRLQGTTVFIGEDYSQRVRNLRKLLSPHLKAAREQGKRATMIYDHLLVDGKKFVLNEAGTGITEAS